MRREVIGGEVSDTPGNYGKDYITLRFRNGSILDLVGALESSLGGRRNGGLIDEIKLHDEEMINTVVPGVIILKPPKCLLRVLQKALSLRFFQSSSYESFLSLRCFMF